MAFHQKVKIGTTFFSQEGLDSAAKKVREKMTNLPKNSRARHIQAAQAREEAVARARVHRIMLDQALQGNGGSKPWQSWKASQAEEVVEDLVNRSPRMEMVSIQLEGDLSLIYRIQMPVPLAPQRPPPRFFRGCCFSSYLPGKLEMGEPARLGAAGYLQPETGLAPQRFSGTQRRHLPGSAASQHPAQGNRTPGLLRLDAPGNRFGRTRPRRGS